MEDSPVDLDGRNASQTWHVVFAANRAMLQAHMAATNKIAPTAKFEVLSAAFHAIVAEHGEASAIASFESALKNWKGEIIFVPDVNHAERNSKEAIEALDIVQGTLVRPEATPIANEEK